jgi:hypothetical protein
LRTIPLLLLPSALLAVWACGGDDDSPAAIVHRPPGRVTEAPCEVLLDNPPLMPASHVPIPTDVVYNFNPPTSGPHYPYWVAFKEFPAPVDRRYYVHNLEHGGVVLLYRCNDNTGCVDVQRAFREVRDALAPDPTCDPAVRVRIVITPDPLLDVPIAASAWGWTYRARCVHKPSLDEFVRQHYRQGPEDLCANGLESF